MKYKVLFAVIAVCGALLVGNYMYQTGEARSAFNAHLQTAEKVCPEEYIVDRMPMVREDILLPQIISTYVTNVREAATHRLWVAYLNDKGLSQFQYGGYFIVDKNRKELFDTDLEWVSKNCTISPSYVY